MPGALLNNGAPILQPPRPGMMTLKSLFEWVETRNPRFYWSVVALIAATQLLATFLVYQTGGSFVVYTHTMYVPVVIAAIVFGLRGGTAAALIGGLMLGPLMPMDVATGAPQSLWNWTFRLAYFLLIAVIIGESSDLIRQYISQVRWRLTHHGASRLPNRRALSETLQGQLNVLKTQPLALSLYLIDVANLNELSLKLGAEFEQVAILALANTLADTLPEDAEVFQVRANRLAILSTGRSELDSEAVGQAIEKAINSPVDYQSIPLFLHCTWSDIDVQQANTTPDDYLRKLEVALNAAQVRKLQHLRYSRAMELSARQNLEVLGLLKHALDSDVLTLKFQPKYRLRDRRLLGVETLLQWTDPGRGIIPPGEFIPLAEESLLITPLTLWVIEKAAAEFRRWHEEGYDLESVAVNISASNLSSGQFLRGVQETVARYQLRPNQLELELTEGAVVADLDLAVDVLNEVANFGVAISVDDFGTGFSSLQYLDRLPVHSVKIDQSFIRNMLNQASNRHIVENTIDLAHRLGLLVVAEGVESEALEQALVAMDCDHGQGYHYAKPMTGDKLRNFVTEQRRLTT